MVVLRELFDSDLETLVGLANNEVVSRYMVDTFPFPYTKSDGQWWLETGSRQNGAITRVIEYQGQFVGSVGIHPQIGWRNHLAQIGYWVAEGYWRKGIATAALAQMTDYGFTRLQLRKLYAPVLAPNIASMKVLEKCGYVLEGLLKAEVQKQGIYLDIHQYARHR
jgi:[ribosomal protein S5]-alanine N-acetyltransferase